MADNNYTISRADLHKVDSQIVAGGQTSSYLCSASLAFSPTSGLSSFNITDISAQGPNASRYVITAESPLPIAIINGRKDSVSFHVSLANNIPSDTTISLPVSVAITGGNAALSAGGSGTVLGNATVYSVVVTASAQAGWFGEMGGRVWPTHAEHMRMRNLGYF